MSAFFRISDQDEIGVAGPVIKKEDYITWLKRDEIIANAEKEAEEILVRAKQRAEETEKEGYQAGLDAGMNEAKSHQEKIAHEQAIAYEQHITEQERCIPGVIMAAVKKVIGEIPPEEITAKVIAQTMNHQIFKKKVSIRVSDADVAQVKEQQDQLADDHKLVDEVDVVADPSLKAGEFILQGTGGSIESSVSEQLKNLEEVITESAVVENGVAPSG